MRVGVKFLHLPSSSTDCCVSETDTLEPVYRTEETRNQRDEDVQQSSYFQSITCIHGSCYALYQKLFIMDHYVDKSWTEYDN